MATPVEYCRYPLAGVRRIDEGDAGRRADHPRASAFPANSVL